MSSPSKLFLAAGWLASAAGAFLAGRKFNAPPDSSAIQGKPVTATSQADPSVSSATSKKPDPGSSPTGSTSSLFAKIPDNTWQARSELAKLSQEELRALVDEYKAVVPKTDLLGQKKLLQILRAWSRLNPQAVLEFVGQQEDSEPWKSSARLTAYASWAAQDPKAAILYHRSHEGRAGTDMLGVAGIYGGWLEHDPEFASLFYQREFDSRKEGQPVTGKFDALDILPMTYRRELLWGDIRQAAELAERIPFGHARNALNGITARSWAALAPEAAFEIVAQLNDGEDKNALVRNLATESCADLPELAAKNVLTLQLEPPMATALGTVFAAWCGQNLTAAIDWIKTQEVNSVNPILDTAYAEIARAEAAKSAWAEAGPWADKIYDDVLRDAIQREVKDKQAAASPPPDSPTPGIAPANPPSATPDAPPSN